MSDQYQYPDNLKITLPESYLTAIGKVCVVWAHLETAMDIAISKLSGLELFDPRSAILTAHMTWPLKLDILSSLIGQLQPQYPHLAKFNQTSPMLKKAAEGRNKIVHAFWGFENDQVTILRFTARGKLKTSMTPVSIADIDAIIDDIGRAAAGLYKVVLNK